MKSRMMRVDKEMDEIVKNLQRQFEKEMGIKLSDPKATRLIARTHKKNFINIKNIKVKRKKPTSLLIDFDMKI